MSKFSPRYLALSAPLVLLLSVLHTPANALPVPILTCTVLPAACCLLMAFVLVGHLERQPKAGMERDWVR